MKNIPTTAPTSPPKRTVDALYTRYGRIIYARCFRILREREAAEDATQETFLRVCRHIERAPDDREVLRWIFRIATNYCLNEIRNQKRRPILSAEVLDVRWSTHADPIDRDLIRRLMQRSSKTRRNIAWLHFVDGLTQEEIADVMSLSRKTVGTHLKVFRKNCEKFVARSTP